MKLLGGLLVTKIYLAAMSRADVPDRTAKLLPNFYLFVDEFQNFANASFADILSEARKYKLNLTIAHQYIEQMDDIVRPAVFGNVGTMIAFRVGATDAEELEKEFSPVFVLEDLVNLGFAQIYLKLMIDGLSSQPFSATTLPPIPHPDSSYVKEIIDASREQFARPRAGVEEGIVTFHNPVVATKSSSSKSITSSASSSATKKVEPALQSQPTAKIDPTPQIPAVKKVDDKTNTVSDSLEKAVLIKQDSQKESEVVRDYTSPKKEMLPQTSEKMDLPKPADVEHMLQSKKERSAPSINSHHSTDHPKPFSLETLASRNKPKTDPKVPTSKNVSDLKNALSAVLAKAKENNKSGGQTTIQNQKQTPSVSEKTGKDASQAPKTFAGTPSNQSPKEVPEDLLKKVLN
jgi:hypothetical protein